jgi:hypothetical protein
LYQNYRRRPLIKLRLSISFSLFKSTIIANHFRCINLANNARVDKEA